jgi:Na+-transporting methylmalonyl-CoA/oxaloacetate decarboxylase gamma subunit
MISVVVPAFAVIPVTVSSQFLAQQPGNGDNGGQGEDFGKSSPVGFLILILFLIAVALLVRSMTKHLKRVPESFDEPASEPKASETPDADVAEGDAPEKPAEKPATDSADTPVAKSD